MEAVELLQMERIGRENLLSDREKQILVLLASGMKRSAIANRLDISQNTVNVHLQNMFNAMGAVSCTNLIVAAVATNQLTSEEIREIYLSSMIERSI